MSSDSSPHSAEKEAKVTQTEHAAELGKGGLGLRSNLQDGEDHEHEPPVRYVLTTALSMRLTFQIDVIPSIYVFDSHGISVDWLSDSR